MATHDVDELGGEVLALDEVDDLGFDGVLRVAKLSTAFRVLWSVTTESLLLCKVYLHGELWRRGPDGETEGVEHGLMHRDGEWVLFRWSDWLTLDIATRNRG